MALSDSLRCAAYVTFLIEISIPASAFILDARLRVGRHATYHGYIPTVNTGLPHIRFRLHPVVIEGGSPPRATSDAVWRGVLSDILVNVVRQDISDERLLLWPWAYSIFTSYIGHRDLQQCILISF